MDADVMSIGLGLDRVCDGTLAVFSLGFFSSEGGLGMTDHTELTLETSTS